MPSKPPAIPETVMHRVLTDTFATISTAGLSWDGHGCSDLLRRWAANQLLTGLYQAGGDTEIARRFFLPVDNDI
jgi:hypothetical protein